MDHWDPLVTDGLAERRSVILVDGAGVGGSRGATPDTIEAMAEDLRHFLTALDVKSLDVPGFSIGGRIAQSLVLQYPEPALSDIDLVPGIISINKTRVSGVDRDKTKTSEDRPVQLCPRALSVLRRHLRLRASLKAAGKIDHDHVFFLETGALFRSLHHPQVRWRKTLQSLRVRYRRPYTARQNSVSWNWVVGKNALWVAKQHSQSIATMLRAYAAWAEGKAEVDIGAIKRSTNVSEAPPVINLAVDLSVAEALQARRASTIRPTALRRHALTDCSTMGIVTGNPLDEVGWGGRIIRPCGPHPFGAVRGALTRVTARTNQPPQRDRQHWPLHRAPRTLSFPPWLNPRGTESRRRADAA